MNLSSAIKKEVVKSKPRTEPLWKGPEEEGITFSLLSRYLSCRERFRLLVIEGLKPKGGFNHRLEYGNMWHIAEEAHASPTQDWYAQLTLYCQRLLRQYPFDRKEVDKWYNVCSKQFPIYVDYWKKHRDMVNRTPLMQEQVFNVPYTLPSGRIVKLRGKWDSVDLVKDKNLSGIWLQENKSKGEIDEEQLRRQLTYDLQTMLYLVSLQESGEVDGNIVGVRYNVIRRPLSGGKGTIRQKQATKNVAAETEEQYYSRLAEYIKEEPQTYFVRWNVKVTQSEIDSFKRDCLNPILENLTTWWDWTTTSKIDADQAMHGLHWRHPYGIWNPLDEGRPSDLDHYLATGDSTGLERVQELFPELQPL